MQLDIQLSMLLLYICSFLTPKFHLWFCTGFWIREKNPSCLGWPEWCVVPRLIQCVAGGSFRTAAMSINDQFLFAKWFRSLQDTSNFLLSSTENNWRKKWIQNKQRKLPFRSTFPCPPRPEYWFHCPTHRHVEGIQNEVVQPFRLHPLLQAYSLDYEALSWQFEDFIFETLTAIHHLQIASAKGQTTPWWRWG